MTTSRILQFAALVAAMALSGCDREGQKAFPPPSGEKPDVEYHKRIDDVNAERKRLMTEAVEAQKSGDQERIAAAAAALAENRRKAGDMVRDHMNLSKEQNK
jgi:hypothetical protein